MYCGKWFVFYDPNKVKNMMNVEVVVMLALHVVHVRIVSHINEYTINHTHNAH